MNWFYTSTYRSFPKPCMPRNGTRILFYHKLGTIYIRKACCQKREDLKDDSRSMRRVMEHEVFRVTERGFSLRRDGTPCCTLTLQRYRVYDAEKRMKAEMLTSYRARSEERKSGKIRLYFRKYFIHIDVPDALPQCPEVREYVNIEPLLSEADKKLLAETECDKGESLLERIAEGDCCRVRARCWTTDKESGKWMRVLSVDI